MDIITPQRLWENYNRSAEPTTNIIFDGDSEKRLYFGGYAKEGCVVRVYARLVLPALPNLSATATGKTSGKTAGKKQVKADTDNADIDTAKPPVIIMAGSADLDIDKADADIFLSKGFAVLFVDYFGKSDKKTHFTMYPRALDAFWESDPQRVKEAPADPQKSCWYYWTTCILHAVTYLEGCGHVDPSKIGIVGMHEGAALVFKSSFCTAIKAGVTFFSGDLVGSGEELLAYKAGLDSRAYAKNAFPILINATTNESGGSFDYLSDLYASAGNRCFCVYPSADRAVSGTQLSNMRLWFDKLFEGGWTVPPKPAISVFASGGAVYAEVTDNAQSVRIFCAEEKPAAYRNWKEIIPEKAGENKYLAKPDVFLAEKPIHVFANISYECGFTFSTPVATKLPSALGATKPEASPSRLLYSPESKTNGWVVTAAGLWDAGALRVEEGPFELTGVCGDSLVNFEMGDSKHSVPSGSLLQLVLCAKQPQDAEISLIDTENGDIYKCHKRITSKEWTTLTLSDEDFKSAKGAPKFDRIAGIKITGKDILLNSMLWV